MPFTVSTHCPSCGADLEFQKGSNAVKCAYCGSAHIVTGHGRTLSYYFPDKITARQAVAAALAALKNERGHWAAKEATLFFVPFQHFQASELEWDKEEIKTGGDQNGAAGFSVSLTRDIHVQYYSTVTGISESHSTAERRFELSAKHIDRTFPALDAPELNVLSLGFRPEVLKLKLFERKEVLARGRVSRVSWKVDELRQKGYSSGDVASAAKALFGKTESTVYSPFWIIEVSDGTESALSVVDAISGDVSNPKAPLALLDKLLGHGEDKFDTATLRPLKCPDCGGDLPVRPDDLVFFCPSCLKAWYVSGSDFEEIEYSAAMPGPVPVTGTELLPFWSIRVKVTGEGRELENKYDLDSFSPGIYPARKEDRSVPLRFFVPAFTIRSLMVLSRLASGFTKRQPLFKKSEPALCARGCTLSPQDALEIAPLILFSLAPKENRRLIEFVQCARVETLGCELWLLPFKKAGPDYIDAFFGWSLPAGAIGD